LQLLLEVGMEMALMVTAFA